MLNAFVKFSLKRKWIAEHISEDLESPRGVSNSANRTQFTDEELDRMHKACDQIGGPVPGGPGARPWGEEDARDFIYLSIYTGLRISDVCLFDISRRLHGNDVFLRMHKMQKPRWRRGFQILSWSDCKRARSASAPKIFLPGKSNNVATVSEQWRRRMEKVSKLAGPFEEKAVPHRFRGTFARVLLERGVGEEDVATLIDDTVEVLRTHYARFVRSRQVRLTNILQDAFADKPTRKILVINKR